MMSLGEMWAARFQELEGECPWPGPRPLSLELDRSRFWRFVGRTEEVRSFLQLIDEHSLLVLHGVSGAGKSSLLEMGLITIMRNRRYTPIVCREWQKMAGVSPEEFIRSVIEAQPWLSGARREQLRAAVDPIEFLDGAFGGRAVLVLDQFEEMIRYQRVDFTRMADWLLSVNKRRRTRVVLSLRSEYVYELKDFLDAARPFTTAYMQLTSIAGDADIRQIISGPNRGGEEVITDEAARLVFELWAALPKEKSSSSLLYLHALLFSLYWARNGQSVDLALVQETIGEASRALARASDGDASDGAVADAVFTIGFDRAIQRKLGLCRSAYLELDPERASVLPSAVMEQVRLLVPHLSSGGYKLERDLLDLFHVACERELDMLCFDDSKGARPVGKLSLAEADRVLVWMIQGSSDLDLLVAGRDEILAGSGVARPSVPPARNEGDLALLGVSPVPWQHDPRDTTAGALLGYAPWEALMEHLRAFAFAIDWLRQASLIRVSSPDDTFMAHLIHDGMGTALKQWSDRHGFTPRTAAHALCAFEGQRWDWWADDTGYFDKAGPGGDPQWRHLTNLRWRYCEVSADIRRTVFVNCDFRGTRFRSCRFEGVTFINCLLDGAVFDSCTLVGEAPRHNPDEPVYAQNQIIGADADALPQFVVRNVDKALIREWNAYRQTDVDGAVGFLYSPTSGVAAVPWTGAVDEVVWEEHLGGLAMYGGRLSSLMVQSCDFSDGSMTLAHVAGSSLDIVEVESLNLTISWSAVRGYSVTRRPKLADAPEESEIRVRVDNCLLYDSWFGADLRGDVIINDCQILALTNLSPGLSVEVVNSMMSHQFGAASDLPSVAAGDMIPLVVRNAPRMSYRSDPAKIEFERRVESARGGA